MKTKSVIIFAVLACCISSKAAADDFLLASPGTELFSETFTEGTISERWCIKQFFVITDGVLKRSAHLPEEIGKTLQRNFTLP